MWIRLGYKSDDPSTWKAERVNMPHHKSEPVKTFAPKAWAAMCELVGGQERLHPDSHSWMVCTAVLKHDIKTNKIQDNLIVNFGDLSGDNSIPNPHDYKGWHTDGDFFTHYLDSPEQALLVLPLFTDIKPHGGGTIICPDGIEKMATQLYNHPEGVSPRMVPRAEQTEDPDKEDLSIFRGWAAQSTNFVEATGEVGDVYLLHPFMLHTASRNTLRTLRIITNPNLAVAEPFNFNRKDEKDYSLVELKTLKALGKKSLPDWKATGPRETVEPARVEIQKKMLELENRRLAGEIVEGTALDGLNGVNSAAPRRSKENMPRPVSAVA